MLLYCAAMPLPPFASIYDLYSDATAAGDVDLNDCGAAFVERKPLPGIRLRVHLAQDTRSGPIDFFEAMDRAPAAYPDQLPFLAGRPYSVSPPFMSGGSPVVAWWGDDVSEAVRDHLERVSLAEGFVRVYESLAHPTFFPLSFRYFVRGFRVRRLVTTFRYPLSVSCAHLPLVDWLDVLEVSSR